MGNFYGSFRILLLLFCVNNLSADSFSFNTYNNHGVLGLINTPSARFYKEGAFGVTFYDGTPDQKITITSSPYDWLEASFFYTNIQDKEYPGFPGQDYKDKGFNFKLRITEESQFFPALAIGINDIAGTGFYSSEYIVGSYGVGKLDMHLGLGWGTLNGTGDLKNPLTYIDNRFERRPEGFEDKGGQFQPARYFSDKEVSTFYGISYSITDSLLFKLEQDTTLTPGILGLEIPNKRRSYSLDYSFNKNFTIGLSSERDSYLSLRFIYKLEASNSGSQNQYKKSQKEDSDSKYGYLIKNLESNGVGVNKIIEGSKSIGLELTQFSHPSLDVVEEIVRRSVNDSGIKEDVNTNYRIANLRATEPLQESAEKDARVIYKRNQSSNFRTSNKISLRPFIAAREGFFKASVLAENNSEYIISDNFFFSSNIKYSIWDNFDDLVIPPVDTYPAQVRSDVKDYLRNFDHPTIGRAQLDYHLTFKDNNHVMFTTGILEEMFAGYGFEYLFFNNKKNYALGFEAFNVQKRDYEMQFGMLDYKNTVGSLNFYYRNYSLIPFDAKISYGEYLAGDVGTTFEFSRSFRNGAQFGVFASFTDVTAEQFGEGTFDKGIFFTIPVFKNLVDYTWRPLTKDPGAKLNRKHTLHDLLVKFRPHNE